MFTAHYVQGTVGQLGVVLEIAKLFSYNALEQLI
jgi:hypothetical protein